MRLIVQSKMLRFNSKYMCEKPSYLQVKPNINEHWNHDLTFSKHTCQHFSKDNIFQIKKCIDTVIPDIQHFSAIQIYCYLSEVFRFYIFGHQIILAQL